MTNEQWKTAEDKLANLFGCIHLKIDGYNITVEKLLISPMKYCLAVFVDGRFIIKWALDDCEIRRRFCRPVRKQLLSGKKKKELIKQIGKRDFEKYSKENSELLYYTYYEPYFNSFRTLKSHLIKNNKSIELMD